MSRRVHLAPERVTELAAVGARWLVVRPRDDGPRYLRRTRVAKLRRLTDGSRGHPAGAWAFVESLARDDASFMFRGQPALVCIYPRGRIVLVFRPAPEGRRRTDTERVLWLPPVD